MSVEFLRLSQFRNIEALEIDLSACINIITGANGAGKTSILEAIYLLARGKSFRSNDTRQQIRHGQKSCEIVLKTDKTDTIGLQRTVSNLTMRCNGQPVLKLSEVAQRLPVFAITPKSHALVEGPPETRRRFIDWGVFHVEPNYGDLVQHYNRLLKQRNASLRQSKGLEKLWDQQLLEVALAITQLRRVFVDRLQNSLQQVLAQLTRTDVTTITLQPGWQGADNNLANELTRKLELDRERGFTSVGPHRADLSIQHHARSVRDTISRGQQKMLAIALLLAQTELLSSSSGSMPTLLIDDMPSELDAWHQERLFVYLSELRAQKIVASIEEPIGQFGATGKKFHVEHGQLKH